jgi:hypothetical protein
MRETVMAAASHILRGGADAMAVSQIEAVLTGAPSPIEIYTAQLRSSALGARDPRGPQHRRDGSLARLGSRSFSLTSYYSGGVAQSVSHRSSGSASAYTAAREKGQGAVRCAHLHLPSWRP